MVYVDDMAEQMRAYIGELPEPPENKMFDGLCFEPLTSTGRPMGDMTHEICTNFEKPAAFGACRLAIQAMDGRKRHPVAANLECRKNAALMDFGINGQISTKFVQLSQDSSGE